MSFLLKQRLFQWIKMWYISTMDYLDVAIFQSLNCVWLFCNPMDCNLPGSSIHGISQARILEWVAISFSRGSSWPRDQTCIFWFGRDTLYHWATWETHNGLLLSHKKKWNNAFCSDMVEPRDDHTKWNVSQRKTNMILFIWEIFKNATKWTYLQSRNRPTDIKNKFMVTKRKWGGGIN